MSHLEYFVLCQWSEFHASYGPQYHASEWAKAATQTEVTVIQHLDYCTTHLDAKIQYYASNKILNIHSDESYVGVPGAKSHVGGHFFFG